MGHPGTLRAAFVLGGLVCFLLRDAVFRGQVFFERDLHLIWHPQVEAFRRSLAAGAWPLWDPWTGFGQPLLGAGNGGLAYPFTLLHLLLDPWRAYTLLVVGHLVFGGVGAWHLGRRLGLSDVASLLAAALWTAGGPLLSTVNLWNHMTALAWMPWAIGAVEAPVGRRRDVVVLAVALAAMVLAGSPDVLVLTALWASGRSALAGRPAVARLAAALALGAALSAVQWLPSLDLLREAARRDLPESIRLFWSVPARALVMTVLPVHDTLPDMARAWSEGRQPYLRSTYVGLAALPLVAAACVRVRQDVRVRVLAGAAAVGVLLALGRHLPLAGPLAWSLPGLSALRFPVKALWPAALALALLAGVGLDAWREHGAHRRAASTFGWAVAVAVLLAVAAGAPVAGGRAVLRAALLLATALLALRSGSLRVAALAVAGDVAVAHHALHPTASPDLYTARPALADRVAGEGRLYVYEYLLTGPELTRRHLGRDLAYVVTRAPAGWPPALGQAAALRMYLCPPVQGVWGLRGSFDRDGLGLMPRVRDALATRLREVEGSPAHRRLLQLGAVHHVAALHTDGLGDLEPAGTSPSLFPEPIHVFRVPDPRPRTYVTSGVRVADGEAALRTVADGGFDPAREVVLAGGEPRPPRPGSAGESRILDEAPDRVTIEASLDGPGHVVLVDGHDPRWTATVDGRSVPLLRANVGFRAVEVSAGRHVVEMRYRPAAALAGAALSLVSLAATAVVGLRR